MSHFNPTPRSSVPRPEYGTGVIEITRQPWWHLKSKYRWHMTFTDCDHHISHGRAETESACKQQGTAADTQHAMHHARIAQRQGFPGRIRAD